jgi:hypothetical protein
MKVYLSQAASRSFIKDLRTNNIAHTFVKGFTTIEVEDTPKVRMAIRMVKERFTNGIKVENN